MEIFNPIPEEVAKTGLARAGANVHGETVRDLIFKYPEGGEAQHKHPIEAEFAARLAHMYGLEDTITDDMVNAVGQSLLAELQENGLLR